MAAAQFAYPKQKQGRGGTVHADHLGAPHAGAAGAPAALLGRAGRAACAGLCLCHGHLRRRRRRPRHRHLPAGRGLSAPEPHHRMACPGADRAAGLPALLAGVLGRRLPGAGRDRPGRRCLHGGCAHAHGGRRAAAGGRGAAFPVPCRGLRLFQPLHYRPGHAAGGGGAGGRLAVCGGRAAHGRRPGGLRAAGAFGRLL